MAGLMDCLRRSGRVSWCLASWRGVKLEASSYVDISVCFHTAILRIGRA